jgi:hypothetical protein
MPDFACLLQLLPDIKRADLTLCTGSRHTKSGGPEMDQCSGVRKRLPFRFQQFEISGRGGKQSLKARLDDVLPAQTVTIQE